MPKATHPLMPSILNLIVFYLFPIVGSTNAIKVY
jgi:hypothetical protein